MSGIKISYKKTSVIQAIFVFISAGLLCIIPFLVRYQKDYVQKQKNQPDDQFFHYSYTPWSNVGGCGGGGSGGGSGDGIKWIGTGVTGGLIDIETMSKLAIGENFRNFTLTPKLSYKTPGATTLSLSIPVMSKSGGVQYATNQEEKTEITGGMGDLSFDVTRTVGMSGAFSVTAGLSLPTGQYDIKRGKESSPAFLPVSLQIGTGLYNASLSINYTKDVETGMWLGSASFGYPFAARPFSKKNEFLDSYYTMFRDSTQNRRFYYRAKPYGENDLGGYTPPNVGICASYAYRGVEHYVHSWTFAFSAPLGVAWIPSEQCDQYAPKPDPDHRAWSAAIAYSLEFSNPKTPFFLAFSLPFHDKKYIADPNSDPMDPKPLKKWDGPDFSDFQATIAIGMKATLF